MFPRDYTWGIRLRLRIQIQKNSRDYRWGIRLRFRILIQIYFPEIIFEIPWGIRFRFRIQIQKYFPEIILASYHLSEDQRTSLHETWCNSKTE